MTGRSSNAHLCAASGVRAMPENEIPPATRGDIYSHNNGKNTAKNEQAREAKLFIRKFWTVSSFEEASVCSRSALIPAMQGILYEVTL